MGFGHEKVEPLVGGVGAGDEELQIVGGEGRSGVGGSVFFGVKREDAEGAVELGPAESDGLLLAEGAELASAALDDVAGEMARK